jgi:hypothetical protein
MAERLDGEIKHKCVGYYAVSVTSVWDFSKSTSGIYLRSGRKYWVTYHIFSDDPIFVTRFYTTQSLKTMPKSRHRRTDCTDNPRRREWFSSGRVGASRILRNSAMSRHVVTYICMYIKGTPVQHTVT